jgi:Transposase DDE domain
MVIPWMEVLMEKTIPVASVLKQLPLAEAVWQLWSVALPDAFLNQLFDQHRGRCYERDVSFAALVHLVSDAVCQHRGSGHQALTRALEKDVLPASMQAIYGKLRRIPIALSEAFLAECTERLLPYRPARPYVDVASSLAAFRVMLFDGKTFKRAAKRLKPVRGRAGKGLGGRALVAMELGTGLLCAFSAHPDGHANEANLVMQLLPQVRSKIAGPRLWVADRQFGDLAQIHRLTEDNDHFVLRYHKKTPFFPDPERPSRSGTDRFGRTWTEEWGWMRSQRQKPFYVRRITLQRPTQETIVIITDLLDADLYPANDLLEIYRERWGIERVFQQVSEVFHLLHLIGSSPQAVIFQGAFCMVLYNLLQVMRTIVADTQDRPVAEISSEKLFYDLNEELIAVTKFSTPQQLAEAIPRRAKLIPDLRVYLHERLGKAWTKRWLKAKPKKYHPPQPKQKIKGGHISIHRILEQARE